MVVTSALSVLGVSLLGVDVALGVSLLGVRALGLASRTVLPPCLPAEPP
jgi:hypothetical protein